jgi:hypothetical protein
VEYLKTVPSTPPKTRRRAKQNKKDLKRRPKPVSANSGPTPPKDPLVVDFSPPQRLSSLEAVNTHSGFTPVKDPLVDTSSQISSPKPGSPQSSRRPAKKDFLNNASPAYKLKLDEHVCVLPPVLWAYWHLSVQPFILHNIG